MGNGHESHLLFISPRQFISMKHSIKTKKVNHKGYPCKDHKIAQIKVDRAAKAAVETADADTAEIAAVAEVVVVNLRPKDSRIEIALKIEIFSTNQVTEVVVVVDEF